MTMEVSSMAGRDLSSNSTEPTGPINIVRGTHSQLILFLFLNMWTSHLGLPLLLAIILLSKKIQRHATFVNLLVAFIVIGISSSLLVYAGQTEGPEPSKLLCLFQASLLYGMPALASLSAFTLVLQMFLVIRASYHGQEMLDRDHVIRLWVMLITPWFGFLVCALATAVVGSSNPDSISRNRRFFYCSVENLSLTNTLTTFSAFLLFGTFVAEVWTMVIIYKRWVAVRGQGSKLRWNMELNLPLRILAFGLFVIVALSLSLLSVKSPQSPVPDLVIAASATMIMLVFGTQVDIVHALCFWRKDRPLSFHKAPNTSYESDRDSIRKSPRFSPTAV